MSTPTMAQPGSEEKIAVMCSRYERGEPIFHPDDVSVRPELRDCGNGGPSTNNNRRRADRAGLTDDNGNGFDDFDADELE